MNPTLQNMAGIYTDSLVNYNRRKSRSVNIGGVYCGGDAPIRVQSMTTVDTMDTEGSVAQSIRMIEAGCEYVRITAPSIKEAENLANIKKELRARGFETPLVADIHFTPNAAELAARIVEKVRVNPGNYADKKRFEEIDYTDDSYNAELDRIREKFSPLVRICKDHGTAMRIGTNHGSLSDRIMSRYGDTPIGMVESALEFIRICEDLDFHEIVVSMKSSNPQVMVQAYRLLVQKLDEEGLQPYPLHLGVTEAGEAEDGRIKSALGIGTLLQDGLGDTIRVSLTEEPEAEIPVARLLVDQVEKLKTSNKPEIDQYPIDPFSYSKRFTREVLNFGGDNVPRVIADYSLRSSIQPHDLKEIGHHYLPELDKWGMSDTGADFIYSGGQPITFMLPNGLREIIDYAKWVSSPSENAHPLLSCSQWKTASQFHKDLNFISVYTHELDDSLIKSISDKTNVVVILKSLEAASMPDLRSAIVRLVQAGNQVPIVIQSIQSITEVDKFIVDCSTEVGGLLVDGLGDGIMLSEHSANQQHTALCNTTAFGILQAGRTRITKTEYISCPSCGRTLFDLQETTAMIRKKTDHLKGIKIGIMGCIVNGPGEMADADYGYVGSGKGKITLYKGKEVMKRGVDSALALDELIDLIREDGNWIEPSEQTV